MRTFTLYVLTAIAEIGGCYQFLLFSKRPSQWWLLPPALVVLTAFAWMLTLHPAASGRVYAAYGGVYIATALLWLWLVDGVRPDRWDVLGGITCLLGMCIIFFGPRPSAMLAA